MNNTIIRMIKELYSIDKKYIFVSLIAVPIGVINPLIDVFFLKLFLETISVQKDIITAIIILAVMFALNAVNLLWDGYICNVYLPIREKKIKMYFKQRLVTAMKNYEVEQYDNPKFYDEFVIVSQEIDGRCIAVWKSCVSVLSLLSTIGTIVTLVITVDPFLTIIALFSAIIGLIPELLKAKTNFEYRNRAVSLDRQENYYNRIVYDKSFIYDAKDTHLIKLLIHKLKDCNIQSTSLKKKFALKNMMAENIKTLVVAAFTLSTWLYLGIRIVYGYYTIASFTSMFNACNSFRNNIKSFLGVISDFKTHKLYSKKIYEFLDCKSCCKKYGNVQKHFVNSIDLVDVCFKYPESDTMAINNLNLSIRKGEKIAIVGRNGAGKSTLIKLLLRYYEPTEGYIMMDGVAYKDIHEESFNSIFSTCQQDFKLYSFSLGENVAMNDTYAQHSIDNALRKVGLEHLISEKDRQVTRDFDEEGIVLSGGEAQRLGIARAINKDSDIMIFDEANSALDPIAEKELNEMIYDVSGDKTTLFISHRLSTAIKADRIVFLDKGKIVAIGTHEELLKKNSEYSKLYYAQAEQIYKNSDRNCEFT